MTDRSARLSTAAREAIRRRLSTQSKAAAVPISRILRHLRSDAPTLDESDDELVHHIVLEATSHGLAVHFDEEAS